MTLNPNPNTCLLQHKWPLSSFAVGQVYCDSSMEEDDDQSHPRMRTWFELKDGPHPSLNEPVGILSNVPILHVCAIGILVQMQEDPEWCRVYIQDSHVAGASKYPTGSVTPALRRNVVNSYWVSTNFGQVLRTSMVERTSEKEEEEEREDRNEKGEEEEGEEQWGLRNQ